MNLYFAGNFPQLSDIEKERAFLRKIETAGFPYNRLVSFSFRKETNTVLSLRKERKGNDPVFEQDGEWFFWAETWASYIGPFPSEEEARTKLDEYVDYLNRPKQKLVRRNLK